MAEKMTPQGLVVGLIIEPPIVEEAPVEEAPVAEKPKRGRPAKTE